MLLGKRPRPPMKRTTSLTEFSVDVAGTPHPLSPVDQDSSPQRQRGAPAATAPALVVAGHSGGHGGGHISSDISSGGRRSRQHKHQQPQQQLHRLGDGVGAAPEEMVMDAYLASMVSPRNVPQRRSSVDLVVETAHFLRACGLCKRRLAPGKDIYMYRGEIAFCSSECRQQQMTIDERKEKCSLTSTGTESSGGGSGGETVAAA